eukprot:scaffold103462_cov57-Phaeocystis_antarctica.AAC.2
MLELAASKATDLTAFVHPGRTCSSPRTTPTPSGASAPTVASRTSWCYSSGSFNPNRNPDPNPNPDPELPGATLEWLTKP